MNTNQKRILVSLSMLGPVALMLLLLFGCSTVPAGQVENLSEVASGIGRGGQPRDAAAWEAIRARGWTNVIKLNTDAEGRDDVPAGFTVKRFPITGLEQVFGPVGPQLESALLAIKPGTYVHCSRGANRTGALIILYRIRVCHWSKAAAIAEAKRFDWDSSLPALKAYINHEPES